MGWDAKFETPPPQVDAPQEPVRSTVNPADGPRLVAHITKLYRDLPFPPYAEQVIDRLRNAVLAMIQFDDDVPVGYMRVYSEKPGEFTERPIPELYAAFDDPSKRQEELGVEVYRVTTILLEMGT